MYPSTPSSFHSTAAIVALPAIAVSALALLGLHALSPQFAPSWRMVSEYAKGPYAWVLTTVFITWSLGSFALLVALWPWCVDTALGKFGLLLLLLAGVGQLMGAMFDINHPLHGPAAMVGIPSLCAAAVMLTLAPARRSGIDAPPMWSAHLPWLSFALMLAAFALFMSALKAAGVDLSAQTKPLEQLPQGVSGYVGWANRLLFAASYLWVALASLSVLKANTSN